MSDKPQTALDLLPTAKDLLKRGMWPQAEVLYRHIVAKDQSQAEVFNDLGIVRACQGALAEAEDFARKAIALDGDSPIFRVNLAKHLFGMDRIDDAEAEVYAALALDCRHEAAIEALELMQEHRKQALSQPVEDDPPADDPSEDEPSEDDPTETERKTVAAPYRGALRKPADALEETPKTKAPSIDDALRSQEEHLSVAYRLFAERDYDAVIHKLRSLEADFPGHPLAALWTALCHFRQDDLKRARHWADRALEIAPKDHAAHMASGLVSQAELAFSEAEASFKKGIELAPKNADFYSALAFQKLLTGDWPEGWRLFDKVSQALTKFRLGSVDPWKGERLDEQSLHIWALEGVGDFLMMARLLPELENRTDHLIIECDERLIPLLQRSLGSVELVPLRSHESSETLPPLGDLQSTDRGVIRHLSPDLHPVELDTGLLQHDQKRAKGLRKKYQERFPGKLLVGLSWYTTSAAQGRARSVLPADLAPLFASAPCQFVDLQYRDPDQAMEQYEPDAGLLYRDDEVDSRNDLDGLAAQMAALDLIITVDNSTAQLAGALGVPGWVLLHQLPDWRWGLRGDSSEWYPSLRLFRQSAQGDWAGVIKQVCAELEAKENAVALRCTA